MATASEEYRLSLCPAAVSCQGWIWPGWPVRPVLLLPLSRQPMAHDLSLLLPLTVAPH
jgi:hypothetical protein